MKEALFYTKLTGDAVQCSLCPRGCRIPPGGRGFCGVRENQAGTLYSLVYGRLCSMAVDPIEKKPLYHFAPGSQCLSVCTVGCNLDCSFCQNWSISHPNLSNLPTAAGKLKHQSTMSPAGTPLRLDVPGENVPPQRIIEIARKQSVEGIAYTYTEPTIFFEYALETMKLARRAGLYNVWVSNGFTNPEPAMEASRYLDAINIDIKGSERFYRKLCNVPSEAAIKRAAGIYREQGVWVETTTLVIPGYNDSSRTLADISRWIRKNLGPETPVHFSRFHPHFRLTEVKSTPTSTLERAHKIAVKEGLKYVYIGNVPGHSAESTRCPECGSPVIERGGFGVSAMMDRCRCGHRPALAGTKWSRLK
jgi:pyruvate formate lyase activating enzyme